MGDNYHGNGFSREFAAQVDQMRTFEDMVESATRSHHSDELLLGPTQAIRDFIRDGDVTSAGDVYGMLSEQRDVLAKIDLPKVDKPSFDKFVDAVNRLELMTRVMDGVNDYAIHEALGFGHNRQLKIENFMKRAP